MKHIFPQQRSCLFTKLTFILFGLAMTQGSFSNNLFFNTVWIRSSFLFIHSTINLLSFRFSGYQPSISRRRFLLQFWRPNSLATWTSQESVQNLSKMAASVDFPVWKPLYVFLTTWLHFPMSMENCCVNYFHRTSMTTQVNLSTARFSTTSVSW